MKNSARPAVSSSMARDSRWRWRHSNHLDGLPGARSEIEAIAGQHKVFVEVGGAPPDLAEAPDLAELPGVQVGLPPGGMYAFLRVHGQDDSLAFAKRLVTEVGLGLAPGAAFGPEAEGWLRWCFASRDPQRLTDGVKRLSRAIGL